MKKLDLNRPVKVKLNDFGIAIIREYNANLRQEYPKVSRVIEIEVDENGYTSSFSLLELMELFGPYIDSVSRLPFENEIMISKKDLKEPSVEKGKSR